MSFDVPIAQDIWSAKYRFSGNEAYAGDTDFTDTARRVAKAAAEAESQSDRSVWEERFF